MQVWVAARQGKSRYLSIWPLMDLRLSNDNLMELSPVREKDEKEYLLPPGGVEAGLCSQFILLHKRDWQKIYRFVILKCVTVLRDIEESIATVCLRFYYRFYVCSVHNYFSSHNTLCCLIVVSYTTNFWHLSTIS